MGKKIQFILTALLLIILFSCATKEVKRTEVIKPAPVKKIKKPINIQVPPNLMGLDETITTQWVEKIPAEKELLTITGPIGITGNDPFTFVVLYVNKESGYALSGDQRFMNYLINQQHNQITVAGTVYNESDHNWLKVLYVLQNGETK